MRTGDRRPHLVIVGTGPAETGLRRLVEELGLTDHVHFAGFRGDVPSVLAATDILCLPSVSEGLPYAVLEACRQAVPVLASRLPGVADLFTEGETMFFTPPGDPAALRDRLVELLDAPEKRRAVGRAARRHVEAQLTTDAMAERVLNAYRREGTHGAKG